MRIALITDGIWPYVLGGMQKHSFYLCKYLARKKVYVDLIHFNQSNYDISLLEYFSTEEKAFIRSIVLDFPSSIKFPGHYLYNSYRYSVLAYEAIKDNLDLYNFIYTKGFTGWHILNLKAAKKIQSPAIGVKFHGYEMFQRAPDLKIKIQHLLLLRKPVRELNLKADVVFSYGGKITEIIRSIGVKDPAIFEMPSGVEASVLTQTILPVSSKIKFLYLGRYERRKGIEELNQALENIIDNCSPEAAEFHFIGPIPISKQLQNKRTIYHGEIRDKEQLLGLIKQCDVLLCPSWSEGMPNVILEAMACGLAVIATDTGATSILVNAKNGWLLENPKPSLIQKTIQDVINTNYFQIYLKKQAALEHITGNFTWEQIIENFYNRFLN